MQPYAAVFTGGKQYLVKAGDALTVEKIEGEAGATVELNKVLAVSDGKTLRLGTPLLAQAKVTATIVQQMRGPKLVSFKKKRRKGFSKKIGHRQDLTVLKIVSIV
jgi:large subunit ribosomal protein L21